MGLLDKAGLLKKEILRIERIDLGGKDFVYVRQMTGRERDLFEGSLMEEIRGADNSIQFKSSMKDFRAKLAVHTLCSESGENILDPSDYEVLSQNMSAFRLEIIMNKSQELNKISAADKEALVKNSEGAQSASSTSGSAES